MLKLADYYIFELSLFRTSMEQHGYKTPCHQHFIRVADRKGEHLLSLGKQVYLEAFGSTTTFVNIDGKRITICRNLGYYEEQLPPCFVRVNKRYIISFHYLQLIRPNNTLKLRIPDCPTITLNATYRTQFNIALDEWNTLSVGG